MEIQNVGDKSLSGYMLEMGIFSPFFICFIYLLLFLASVKFGGD